MVQKRVSVKSTASKALKADDKARKTVKSTDSFTNFAQSLGIGADNPLSTASYGFNPITRVRTLLEWIHRGSWVGRMAVDVIAEDMTREGVDFHGQIEPEDAQKLHQIADRLNVWSSLCDVIAWARLYGGAIGVILIDGQDQSTPLNIDTIGRDAFKGILPLDRWMVEPSLSNLVTEFGPDLGLPKFYTVRTDAPALPSMRIHYSRVIRMEGARLPYWQRVMENLWGVSILEPLYDRMVAFDSATTGAAQLVYKAYLRTYKIKDMREIIASGGPPMAGLTQYVEMMRRFQSIEGITLMDAEDEFEGHSNTTFAGLSDALVQFGQQLSGATQIPLVRMFGQSPAGFNTGDADLRNYYDGIKPKQKKNLGQGVDKMYRCMARSADIVLMPDFGIDFRSLWQTTDKEKADIANVVATAVSSVEGGGVIDRSTALKELKQSSRVTGIFANITQEQIDDAEGEMAPPPDMPKAEGEQRAAGEE
jgi:uncharacterized protein